MKELKRWREERWARQTRRVLEGARGFTSPRVVRRPIEPTRGRSRFSLWPVPPPVSPVHPEWDDPTGARFRGCVYRSMVAHVVLIPAIVYVSNLDINFRPAPTTIKGRTFVIVDPGSPRRPRQAPVGPVRPHSPKPAEQDRKTKNQVPKSEAPRTDRPRGARPVPAKKQQEDRPVAPVPPVDNPKPDQAPVTDPIADEGPLLAGAGPVAGSEASIGGLDGVDFPYNYYLEVVRAKVAQAWVVPQGSASRGRRIESTIRFRILRDGSVSESRVEEPSGLSIYDQAALRAVSNVRRFPPLPQEFGGEFLVVHFQFSFVGR